MHKNRIEGFVPFILMIDKKMYQYLKPFPFCYSYSKGETIYDQLKKLGSSLDWDRACFTLDKVTQNCDIWTQNSSYGLWDICRCIHMKYLLFFVRICQRQWLRPLSNFMMRDWSTEKTKWSIGLASYSLWFQILRWINSYYYSVVHVNQWLVERLFKFQG